MAINKSVPFFCPFFLLPIFRCWAFEAAAIAFLYEVDESKADHLIHPRDLVEYARNYTGSTAVQMDQSGNKAI